MIGGDYTGVGVGGYDRPVPSLQASTLSPVHGAFYITIEYVAR